MAKKQTENYSKQETQQRFEAALRGARVTGHKPMSEVVGKQKGGKSKKMTKAKPPK